MASSTAMWTSKLGNKYPMAEMQQNDRASQQELKRLRGLKGSCNSFCADCGRQDTTWASVSHGVFICVICSDVHRSVGTHITKVKGCTGTYLWGPDELEQMRTIGNQGGEAVYGVEKISPDASKEEKQRFVINKYEKLLFAGSTRPKVAQTVSAKEEAAHQDAPVVRRAEPAKPERNALPPAATIAAVQPSASAAPAVLVADMSEAFFDDFFNESQDSYFGASAVPVKSPATHIAPQSCTDNGLEAFLNTTLHSNAQPAPNVSGYPASLDPFADWLDF